MPEPKATLAELLALNILALQKAYAVQNVPAIEIAHRWEEICLLAKDVINEQS